MMHLSCKSSQKFTVLLEFLTPHLFCCCWCFSNERRHHNMDILRWKFLQSATQQGHWKEKKKRKPCPICLGFYLDIDVLSLREHLLLRYVIFSKCTFLDVSVCIFCALFPSELPTHSVKSHLPQIMQRQGCNLRATICQLYAWVSNWFTRIPI